MVIYYFFSLLAGGYCGFHRGKPVLFANRVPSWIFEARAPGYEQARAKIERGGREGETPSFPLFAPPAPSPRVTFLSTTARPLLLVAYYPKWQPRKANTGFSHRRKTPTPTGRLFFYPWEREIKER